MRQLRGFHNMQQVLLLHNCCCRLRDNFLVTFLGQIRYCAWISTLIHKYGIRNIRIFSWCGKIFNDYDVYVGHLWSQALYIYDNYCRGCKAYHVLHNCHWRRVKCKHRWQIVCLQSELCWSDPASLLCAKRVARDSRSIVVQKKVCDEPKRSVLIVRYV